MNISVPDELAEKVRALDLPISSVCQKALAAAVAVAERDTTALNIDVGRVAARLRATVDAADQAERDRGRYDGIAWATDHATADDLAKLADGESDGLDPHSPSLIEFMSASLGQNLVEVNVDAEDQEAYWDGFMAGAMQVWEAVYHLV